MAAGSRRLLDFVMYNTGSTTQFVPGGVVGGTPLMFDMQQPGLMEMQSFFPAWAMCNPVRVAGEIIDISCGVLGNDIAVGGLIDSQDGMIHCCL